MNALQTKILKRFMTDKQFDTLLSKYEDNKLRGGNRHSIPQKIDFGIFDDYRKNGMMPNELMKKYKVGLHFVNTAIRIVALSKLDNQK